MSGTGMVLAGLNLLRALLDVLVPLVPIETLKGELDDAAVRRANAIANAAQTAKGLK